MKTYAGGHYYITNVGATTKTEEAQVLIVISKCAKFKLNPCRGVLGQKIHFTAYFYYE